MGLMRLQPRICYSPGTMGGGGGVRANLTALTKMLRSNASVPIRTNILKDLAKFDSATMRGLITDAGAKVCFDLLNTLIDMFDKSDFTAPAKGALTNFYKAFTPELVDQMKNEVETKALVDFLQKVSANAAANVLADLSFSILSGFKSAFFSGGQNGSLNLEQPAISAKTDSAGRKLNEDGFVVHVGDEILLGVADGMGGHQKGEEASRIGLRNTVLGYFDPGIGNQSNLVASLQHANDIICGKLYDRTVQHQAGSTLALVKISGDQAEIASIGDSRVYLVRQGKIHMLTYDHSLACAVYTSDPNNSENLAPEENLAIDNQDLLFPNTAHVEKFYRFVQTFPNKNIITGSLGQKETIGPENIQTFKLELQPGDLLVAMSDGVQDYVTWEEFSKILTMPASSAEITNNLYMAAAEANSKDNVTIVSYRHPGQAPVIAPVIEPVKPAIPSPTAPRFGGRKEVSAAEGKPAAVAGIKAPPAKIAPVASTRYGEAQALLDQLFRKSNINPLEQNSTKVIGAYTTAKQLADQLAGIQGLSTQANAHEGVTASLEEKLRDTNISASQLAADIQEKMQTLKEQGEALTVQLQNLQGELNAKRDGSLFRAEDLPTSTVGEPSAQDALLIAQLLDLASVNSAKDFGPLLANAFSDTGILAQEATKLKENRPEHIQKRHLHNAVSHLDKARAGIKAAIGDHISHAGALIKKIEEQLALASQQGNALIVKLSALSSDIADALQGDPEEGV